MTNLVHNETTKLVANALDRASTACLTVGVFAPIAAAIYTFAGNAPPTLTFVIGAVCWIFAAAVLHMSARYVLRRLL